MTNRRWVVPRAAISLATGSRSIDGNKRRLKAAIPTALGNSHAKRKGSPAEVNPRKMSDTLQLTHPDGLEH